MEIVEEKKKEKKKKFGKLPKGKKELKIVGLDMSFPLQTNPSFHVEWTCGVREWRDLASEWWLPHCFVFQCDCLGYKSTKKNTKLSPGPYAAE